MNVEMALCLDKTPRYYITHESANESLVLTEKEAEDLYNHLHMILHKGPEEPKDKLIIHETDCHGCGCLIYEDKVEYYAYDDNADMRVAVEELIEIGFINPEDVVIIKGEEIYDYLKEG